MYRYLLSLFLGFCWLANAEVSKSSAAEVHNHLQDWAHRQQLGIHPMGNSDHSNYFGQLRGWVSDEDAARVYEELYRFTRNPSYRARWQAMQRDRLKLPRKFIIRQKFFSFPTATFEIKDDSMTLGTVTEKFFALTRSFEIKDRHDKKIGSARQKFFSWGVEIEVFDQNDQKIGSIKEQIWKSFFKVTTTYSILDPAGRVLATSEKIDWIGTRFDITAGDKRLIHMERPWMQWTLTDNWKVEMYDKETVHPYLLLMSAIYKTSVDNERRAAADNED